MKETSKSKTKFREPAFSASRTGIRLNPLRRWQG